MCQLCVKAALVASCVLPAELYWREVNDTGQIAAEDGIRVLYRLVTASFQMDETKESFIFKGVAERLTLGITRLLGVYPSFLL